MLTDENQDQLLVWAEKMARDAGKIMREYFELDEKQVEIKSNKTKVTIADTKINDLLIERVAKDFPEHGVLGEENSDHADRNKLWVCDPLDGTHAYIIGIPIAMFSLALVVDGDPVLAVMYDPWLDRMFAAIKGNGATLNGRKIYVSEKDSLQGAQIGISGSTLRQDVGREVFVDMLDEKIKTIIVPGEVFRGGLTSSGKLDSHIFPGRGAHDVAAEKLIVEEAGGKVTDLDGNEQRYDRPIRGAIVSNGKIHQALVDQLAKFNIEDYLGY